MGASEETALTEEEAPSFAEAWRIVWKIESLRRIWYSLPFLAVSLIGFATLAEYLVGGKSLVDGPAAAVKGAARAVPMPRGWPRRRRRRDN